MLSENEFELVRQAAAASEHVYISFHQISPESWAEEYSLVLLGAALIWSSYIVSYTVQWDSAKSKDQSC